MRLTNLTKRFEDSDFAMRLRIFFEAQEVPYSLALFRIALPLVLLVGVVPRWRHVRELFSTDGSPTPLWETYGQVDLLPILPPAAAVALYTVLVFCLVTSCLGWNSRVSLFISTVLYPYFGLLDSLGTITKYTVIGTHLLMLLALSECGSVWSLDAWIKQQKSETKIVPNRAPVWPRRLIQLLIGVVYLGAAMTKLQTPQFFNGDQLSFWMLTNVNYANPLGEYLSLYPTLILAFGYCTVIWEVLFLFLAWRGYAKYCMIGIGLMFHVMTFLTLGLLIFPLMFACCYLAFLEVSEAKRVGTWFSKIWRKTIAPLFSSFTPLPVKSFGTLTAFIMMVTVLSTISVTTEAHMDVYGEEHTPDGRTQLTALSADQVSELFRNDIAIHPQDNIFSMDLGTTLAGGLLADHRRHFSSEETAIVQCRLVTPHDDLWLEVTLHNLDGQVLKRNGLVAPREESCINFNFPLDVLTAGDYAFVLKVNGQDAHHRKFSVRR